MQISEGHDGPYAAPLLTSTRTVPHGWIDYNGHMNVAHYMAAFDQATDEVFERHLGIGEDHTKRTQHGPYVVQSTLHYLAEFLEGAEYHVRVHLVDHDQKRMHLFLQMIDAAGAIGATGEIMMMNVDLTTRRSTPYPDWVQVRQVRLARMQAAHDLLPNPAQLGATIGIRRKG
ncbi:MAG: thioesterase family protein [Rhodobacteraceae bacterium]|nr:thioesterase family protein [Paracoccaceae bacterium]